MIPLWPLFFVFVALPLGELYLLIKVGSQIGALSTILLSIFTAALGAALVRWQGFGMLMRVRESMARGEPPALEMMEGALILLAGFMLLLPGFVTDALGFLMLVPPLRRWLTLALLKRSGRLTPAGSEARVQVNVIEGKFRRDE